MEFRKAAIAAAGVFAIGMVAVAAASAEGYRHGGERGEWRGPMHGGGHGGWGHHGRGYDSDHGRGHGRGHGHARGHGGYGGHGPMGARFALLFDLLDVDADNTVSREEALRPVGQRFARVDTDGDGFATDAELAAAEEIEPGRFGPEIRVRFDADGDERVSAAEFAVRARAMFARADANDDGSVSYTEFRAVRHGMHGPGPDKIDDDDMPANAGEEVEDEASER